MYASSAQLAWDKVAGQTAYTPSDQQQSYRTRGVRGYLRSTAEKRTTPKFVLTVEMLAPRVSARGTAADAGLCEKPNHVPSGYCGHR